MCMMMCHVLLAGCSVAFVYVSKKLVDVAVAILGGRMESGALTGWAVAMVAVIFLRVLLNATKSYLQTRTDIALRNRLRYNLFNVLLHVRNEGGARHHSGDVLNRMQEDVRQVASVLAVSIPDLFGTLLQFAAAFGFLVYLDVRLAFLVVVIIPLGLAVGKYVAARIRHLTLDIRSSDSRVQAHLQESFQHLTLLQTLEYVGASTDALGDLQTGLYGKEMRRARFSVLSRIVIALAFSGGHAVAFLWGVWGISAGTVTYGMMTAFLQLVGQIQRPLMDMSAQLPAIIHATASIDRLMELEALPREEEAESVLLPAPAGVRIEDVSFAYAAAGAGVSAGAGVGVGVGVGSGTVSGAGVASGTISGSASGSDSVSGAVPGLGSGTGIKYGRLILDGFSYDFRPGSRTAIVGPTGVGKSTLIRLMLALLTPLKGHVSVYSLGASAASASGSSFGSGAGTDSASDSSFGSGAGTDSASASGSVPGFGSVASTYSASVSASGSVVSYTASPATRCNLVYVPQGNTLFSGTVRENLLMGNPDATDEQLRSALHTAAADFVFALPNGLDTQCFESGAGLSEGQAQRIAIARALLRPGSILLLDEFSSALDAETESTLLERLTSELPDHTMIFITHRDRIIDFCDSVLRLG